MLKFGIYADEVMDLKYAKGEDDNEAIKRGEEKIELFGEYRESHLHGNERQVGCPPRNNEIEEPEMSVGTGTGTLPHNTAEEFVRKVWRSCHFHALPHWLQDNDFLHDGHRPPLNSFWACFKSIFRVHTETVNIWTHLLGCIGFMGIAVYFLIRASDEVKVPEKLVFMLYFAGTIICLGLSSAFHTLHCHSEWVGKLFNKLDYCGIAVLIMVSFVPWLYFGFYCHLYSKIVYTTIVLLLGLTSIIVSLWERFSHPQLRPLRTSVFIVFGLSGVVPAIHYVFVEGWFNKIALASLGWLSLMGSLYIIGALIYVMRIPERFFPGKCDIWVNKIFLILLN
ncbi:hypothetical protein V9T40_006037 [Parthenolecanium corni]|uniref:Uncharacterized protein n=1 Tax=Parthenolecanium corni TaxID=536013 RepID=A0AAN9YA52_9HEMI